METGYDILFFWVARMIMMGLENTGQVPFHTVFLHGLIRDELGQKMSKTKGNVVDPLETAGQYGTDALRFALTTGTSPGNDARLTPIKLENARNFANKIWNASRFVLTAADQATGFTPLSASERGRPQAGGEVTLEDRWVLSRLHHTIDEVSRMLEAFQIGEAQRAIYEFLWNDYCDWYIELAKIRLRPGAAHPGSDRGVPPERDASAQSPLPVLVHVLEQTMRLLHPFMPYVTEEVWQVIVQRLPDDPTRPASIMVAPYPAADPARYDLDAERRMGLTIEIITAIRNARAELKVDPAKQVEAIVDAAEHRELVLAQRAAIETLARANPLRVYGNGQPAPAFEKARVAVLGTVRVIVPTAGLVDVESERRKATDEIAQIERSIGQIDARLASPEFTSKAPPAVVEKERARLADYREKLAKLRERLKELG
jgi:valyl-tRNA synthetase